MSNLHDFQTLLSAYNQLLLDLQSTAEHYHQEAFRCIALRDENYGIYFTLFSSIQIRITEVEDTIEATRQQIIELSAAIN